MFIVAVLISLLALASAGPTFNVSDTSGSANITWIGEGIIPVSKMGCWEDTVPKEEADIAKGKLAHWGGFKLIGAGSWHGEEFSRAGVWICNCKHFYSDHAVPWELDEAQKLIRVWCGVDRAGWVWSYKWQKSINCKSSPVV
ncbi:hypothetical protein ANO14919_080110 [Xylariales sp. No.14919]|nr:hypothetical protein ANO14919_080110 [Xylariales sp. No.14919]